MDDIDRVFARFKDDKPEPADRRETLSIPRRSGAGGSRTVEVVHLRSGRGTTDRPQRLDPRVRAASWDGGFQAKRATATPDLPAPVTVPVIAPTTHVMPAWDPAVTEQASSAPGSPIADEAADASERRGRGRPRKYQVGEQAAAVPAAAHAVEPTATPRRGRGRPRKHPASESAVATADATRAEEAFVMLGHDLGRPRRQPASAPTRRIADPFNASDEGANCMRCGYAIEATREKRGLMTCSECG